MIAYSGHQSRELFLKIFGRDDLFYRRSHLVDKVGLDGIQGGSSAKHGESCAEL